MRWWKLTAVMGGLGGAAALAITLRRRKPARKLADDRWRPWLVDEAGLESFPASDPPAWTLGTDG